MMPVIVDLLSAQDLFTRDAHCAVMLSKTTLPNGDRTKENRKEQNFQWEGGCHCQSTAVLGQEHVRGLCSRKQVTAVYWIFTPKL